MHILGYKLQKTPEIYIPLNLYVYLKKLTTDLGKNLPFLSILFFRGVNIEIHIPVLGGQYNFIETLVITVSIVRQIHSSI